MDNDADDPADLMAAVDLGSNSFHVVVARAHHGQLAIVDRLREMVRLASGLDDAGNLDDSSQERALACLRRVGQRLRSMPPQQVRVVGTSTLRKARNVEGFLAAAEQALGHPVEVISGMEEARLIYLGVSRHVDSRAGANLVADIGGGSTELIIGAGDEPQRLESLHVGCVGLSRRFFDGGLGRKRFDRARLAVRLELRPMVAEFQRHGWNRAIGSSGTIRAAGAVARELGLEDGGISAQSVEAIIGRIVEARSVEALPGLGGDRAPVFAGGIAILAEIMSSLGIGHMTVSDGALRDGLLYDLLGRMQHEDAREVTIRALQRRYHVDEEQAQRVESTAMVLLEQVEQAWGIADERHRQLLAWAARLHEVGLDIAHSKYHLHGGYLLAHADLPGFVRQEQQLLAALVRSHRRKLDEPFLADVPEHRREPMFRLVVLMRLAVLLNRARNPLELPRLQLAAGPRLLELRFPAAWLAANPLTEADLEQERGWLRARGFELRIGAAADHEASAS